MSCVSVAINVDYFPNRINSMVFRNRQAAFYEVGIKFYPYFLPKLQKNNMFQSTCFVFVFICFNFLNICSLFFSFINK